MRQVLSWRFLAAVLALAVLTLAALLLQSGRKGLSSLDSQADVDVRTMDVIALVTQLREQNFEMTERGTVSGTLVTTIQVGGESRQLQIFEGTPGEVTCVERADYRCVLLAQTLADTVVWFALLPVSEGQLRFEIPAAVTDLQGGRAQLTNGWRLPYARVIDRSCDSGAASFSEFIDRNGTNFTTIYDLSYDDGRGGIVSVVCGPDVPAPAPVDAVAPPAST